MKIAEIEVKYKTHIAPEERYVIKGFKDVETVCRVIWSENIEWIEESYILLLASNNSVLGWKKIGIGGVSSVIMDPKVIFQLALGANASFIVLAHNHPSGNLQPSEADKKLCNNVVKVGEALNLRLIDNVILTKKGMFSFANAEIL